MRDVEKEGRNMREKKKDDAGKNGHQGMEMDVDGVV